VVECYLHIFQLVVFPVLLGSGKYCNIGEVHYCLRLFTLSIYSLGAALKTSACQHFFIPSINSKNYYTCCKCRFRVSKRDLPIVGQTVFVSQLLSAGCQVRNHICARILHVWSLSLVPCNVIVPKMRAITILPRIVQNLRSLCGPLQDMWWKIYLDIKYL
jgi:hypothetical protein